MDNDKGGCDGASACISGDGQLCKLRECSAEWPHTHAFFSISPYQKWKQTDVTTKAFTAISVSAGQYQLWPFFAATPLLSQPTLLSAILKLLH